MAANGQALTESDAGAPPAATGEGFDYSEALNPGAGAQSGGGEGLFARLLPSDLVGWLENYLGPNPLRKIGMAAGAVAIAGVGAGILLVSQEEPEFRTLYGELSSEDASRILEALDERGVEVQFDERTGEIRVPERQVHRSRIFLAGEGLPRRSGFGYEMLEEDPGFGVSEFMEHARFDRALETELARSIQTMQGIDSARVHLDAPEESVFVRDRSEPRASVVLELSQDRRLSDRQTEAIRHLVASAVADLEHENVSIVDHRGRLLTADGEPAEAEETARQFEFQRRLEERLQRQVEDLVTPIVGPDRVRAQVSARLDFSQRSQIEELFDPESSSIRSEQMSERSTGGSQWPIGIPGALTNQPPGPGSLDPDGDGPESPAGNFGSSETRNWEVGRTLNQVQSARGTIDRLTVGLLIDHRYVQGEDGQVTREPLSDDEMAQISNLVEDAVGYDEGRGDAVSVVTVPFAEILERPDPPEDVWEQEWVRDLIRLGVFGLIGLLIYVVAIRPIVNRVLAGRSEEEDEEAMAAASGGGRAEALEGPPQESEEALQLAGVGGEELGDMRERPYEAKLQAVLELVENEPELAANAIKQWLNED